MELAVNLGTYKTINAAAKAYKVSKLFKDHNLACRCTTGFPPDAH